ncbi:MAG TPA: hypothetical protein VEI97_06515 [bacterium]|nr:hypothetical protein [bacterium]
MTLPSGQTLADLGAWVLIVVGAALALFGLGIYRGALSVFGSFVGGLFGLLVFMSNREALPPFGGAGPFIFGLLFPVLGGWIGAWLARGFHYVLFFVLGCVMGYAALLVVGGQMSWAQLQAQAQMKAIPGPHGWQWIVMAVVGFIYMFASNWMIAITCAFLGASLLANVLKSPAVLYGGALLGIFMQWVLFLRNPVPERAVVRRVVRRGDYEG